MTMQKRKIGAGQLFCLLYICRMLTTVTFSPILSDGLLSGNNLPDIVFAALFIFLLCIPAYLFYKRFPSGTPLSVLPENKASVPALFYCALFLFSASVSVSRFYIFLTSVIYPEKNMSLFLVIAVLLCAYCSYLGIEALSRGNVILLFITALGTAAILFTSADKISFYNLEPILFNPISDSVKSGFFAAGRTVEAAAFLFLAAGTKGNIKKGFFVCISLFVISLLLLFFFLGGVSGKFAETQLFPFYSLAIISKFPFFERLDAVVTAIWIFSILIKCSLFMYIAGEQLNVFSFMNVKRSLTVCFLIITVLSQVFSINLTVHKAVSSPYVFAALTLTGAVLIPLAEIRKIGKGREI